MGLIFPAVWVKVQGTRSEALPPGISAPEKKLLRVWMVGDPVGAAGWLKRQAAYLEQAQGGAMVYLRTARPQELIQPETVLPDLVIFGPGAVKAPESLFVPLAGDFPLGEGAKRAGRWQLEQYAMPICLDGYALAYDPSVSGLPAATPAPTPLLGIGGMPSATPEPEEKEQNFAGLAAALSKAPRGKTVVYDFQCAAGMPFLLFAGLSGGQGSLSAASLPSGFGAAAADTAASDFVSGRCHAAMLSARQLRTVSAQNKTFALLPAPVPATDLYLAAGVIRGEGQDLALSFLSALLSKEGQADLAGSGLFAVRQDTILYGTDPVFSQVEGSLKGEIILPNAFSYDPEALKNLSRSTFHNGGVLKDILESIR
jgi:hypothetical protein